MPLGSKLAPSGWVTISNKRTTKENFKILFLSDLKAKYVDVWYVACPYGPLPNLLAHLSTMCSKGAIVVVSCRSSIGPARVAQW